MPQARSSAQSTRRESIPCGECIVSVEISRDFGAEFTMMAMAMFTVPRITIYEAGRRRGKGSKPKMMQRRHDVELRLRLRLLELNEEPARHDYEPTKYTYLLDT